MKRERTVLTVLGAIFAVELFIGIPALRHNIGNDDALPTVARATQVSRTTQVVPSMQALTGTPAAPSTPAATETAAHATTPSVRAPVSSETPIRARRQIASLARPRQVEIVDDLPNAADSTTFSYSGNWEHVRGMDDGRTAGTSSRSFRPDAKATLRFTGSEVRLFGVCGPHGGRAQLTIDGRSAGPVDFYASAKVTHMLVYRSPRLPLGTHSVSISVAPGSDATKKRYINIDGAEVDS